MTHEKEIRIYIYQIMSTRYKLDQKGIKNNNNQYIIKLVENVNNMHK